MPDLTHLLAELVAADGSDLFLSVGAVPQIKVEGRLQAIDSAPVIDSQTAHTLCYSIMNDAQRSTFDSTMELNMGLQFAESGRFPRPA